MKRTRWIAAFVGVAAVSMIAADASAMYHPGHGRFMQRDPGAGTEIPSRPGTNRAAPVSGEFVPRDSTGSNQYADGPNLYQYVQSNPVIWLDPQGTKRLQYGYLAVYATNSVNRDNNDILAKTQFLEKDVEDLLWAYGINAWRTGANPSMDTVGLTHIEQSFFSSGLYDFTDLRWRSDWKYAGSTARKNWGNGNQVDDVIIFIPGGIGTYRVDGLVDVNAVAAHSGHYHVIAVSNSIWATQTKAYNLNTLVHEILHHFLEDTINPKAIGFDARAHDTEGVMHPAGGKGGDDLRLGCRTVEALKKKGVTDAEIEAQYRIKK